MAVRQTTDVTAEIEEKRNLGSHTGAEIGSETGWIIEGRTWEDERLDTDVIASIANCARIAGVEALKS